MWSAVSIVAEITASSAILDVCGPGEKSSERVAAGAPEELWSTNLSIHTIPSVSVVEVEGRSLSLGTREPNFYATEPGRPFLAPLHVAPEPEQYCF